MGRAGQGPVVSEWQAGQLKLIVIQPPQQVAIPNSSPRSLLGAVTGEVASGPWEVAEEYETPASYTAYVISLSYSRQYGYNRGDWTSSSASLHHKLLWQGINQHRPEAGHQTS